MTTENPYAFPIPESESLHPSLGMTLRDYFAARALQAIMGSEELMEAASDRHNTIGARDAVCKSAYETADAMLKARMK